MNKYEKRKLVESEIRRKESNNKMKPDSNKFSSYEKLIDFAKKLDNDKQRIQLICDYFINNVSYNYAYLETIRIDTASTGIEEMVSKIDLKYNAYKEQERILALDQLKQKMSENMQKRYVDKILIEKVLKEVMESICIFYGNIVPEQPEREVIAFGNKVVQKAVPKRVISLVEAFKIVKNENSYLVNPNVVENGLIKKGVCAEFAPYIKEYCDELGILCEIVGGIGTVKHVWNLVKLNGKIRHTDLTNAIFIRDGYGDNNSKLNPQDWYVSTTEKMFNMQPYRKINKIGSKCAKQQINIENYVKYKDFINNSI